MESLLVTDKQMTEIGRQPFVKSIPLSNKDLHFIALPGSVRRMSFSLAIAETLDEIAPDDVCVEVITNLSDFPLYNQDLLDEGIPREVELAARMIDLADGMIIVTPEYNHSIPGVLKNALDWFSCLSGKPVAGKPTAIQTSSPDPIGGARAQEHVRQVLIAMDAAVLNGPEVIIARVAGKVDATTGRVQDRQTRFLIAAQLKALAASARVLTPRAS